MLSKKFQLKFPRCQSQIRTLGSVDVMKAWQVFPRGNQPLEIETFQDFPGNGTEFRPIAISTRLDSVIIKDSSNSPSLRTRLTVITNQ